MQGFRVCCTAAWGASTVNNSSSWMGTRLWSKLWHAVHSIILDRHFSTVEPHRMSTGQRGCYELAVTGQMITMQSIRACHAYSGSEMNTDECRSHSVPMQVRSERYQYTQKLRLTLSHLIPATLPVLSDSFQSHKMIPLPLPKPPLLQQLSFYHLRCSGNPSLDDHLRLHPR